MRTPVITIFVVCVLVMGLALALYDYRKHGVRQQDIGISKSQAHKLKTNSESAAEQSHKENYETAIDEYKQALKVSPRDAYLHNDLGTAYYRLGLENMNPPVEEGDFGYGNEVDARHLEGSEPLEEVKQELSKMESGIVTAVVNDESIEKEISTYARSLGHYAHVEEEAKENGGKEFWVTIITGKTREAFLDAERAYLRAINIKSIKDKGGRRYSNYATASRNLGTLYFRMGRKRDAVNQWRRAFQLEPTDAELRNLLGKYESSPE
jgi:tetratricopeptide (TPR) repeat protein